MKFIYGLVICFSFFVPSNCFAAPMSGTYTIGGTSPDFATFSAAAASLNNNGVNGPVTFNARPGTYNESFTINNITGASLTNPITFQSETGELSSVIITYTTSTVVLNGSRYVTFRDMTINATANIYGTTKAFVLQGNCNTDSILNCSLSAPIAPWTDYTFVIHASSGTNDNIVVDGCQVTGGGFGYEVEGGGTNFGPYLTNNCWVNQTYMAVNIMGCKNAIVQGNTINSSITGSRFGIIVWQGCDNVKVLNNVIYGVYQQGMYIPSPQGGLIANNFIQADWGIYGISSAKWKIYNNNFRSNIAIYMTSSGRNNELRNNIFYSHNGGTLLTLDSTSHFNFDNNAYYTTGKVASVSYVNYTTLADWQNISGQDANSRTVQPPYVSSVDLHLTSFSSFDFGTPLSEVTTDVDFTPRGANPMVGADDSGTRVATWFSQTCCPCFIERPKVGFTASPTTVCETDTVFFTDQSTNGPGNWLWTFDGGVPATSGLQNPVVVYPTAGTYNVKLVATTQSGTDSVIKTGYITVNGSAEAGIVTGVSGICQGDSARLTVAGNTGSLVWQSSTDGILYADIPGISSTAFTAQALTQTTYFRTKAITTCGTDSSTAFIQTVVPLPVPVLSITDSIFCSGDSVQVCASGAVSYRWNNNATASCIYASAAGGYWVTATGDSGCTAVSSRSNMSIYPVPSVSIIVKADTLSSFGAVAYQWYKDGELINGATGPVYIAPVSGDYTLKIEDANGCTALSSIVHVDVTEVGVEEVLVSTDIGVYPNPFTDFISIQAKGITGTEVYDMMGRTVYSNNSKNMSLRLNLLHLPAGMYYLKVLVGDKSFFKQLVKN